MGVAEAAALLGMDRFALYQRIHRGSIPSQRVGRTVLLLRSDVLRLRRSLQSSPTHTSSGDKRKSKQRPVRATGRKSKSKK